MTSRWATRTRKTYLGWLHLVSHEFFHVWNVKRLRPVELGPFDYETENYTRSLWIAEGITEYYGPLTVRRAGLSTTEEYLSELSDAIRKLQTTPGRLVQSAEQASFDAWIKLYRPDREFREHDDQLLHERRDRGMAARCAHTRSHGRRDANSLDDVMRTAFARYSGAKGFTTAEFKSVASEIAGVALDEFFRRTVESTEELDYGQALEWFGLRFKEPDHPGGAVAGWATHVDHGRLVVTKVPRDTPAAQSGINVDDEILAIDDFRVRPDQISKRLECYRPGDRVSILLARREVLKRVEVTLGEEPRRWTLELLAAPTEKHRRNLAAWLGL